MISKYWLNGQCRMERKYITSYWFEILYHDKLHWEIRPSKVRINNIKKIKDLILHKAFVQESIDFFERALDENLVTTYGHWWKSFPGGLSTSKS